MNLVRRLWWFAPVAAVVVLTSCVDHGDPALRALVVSVDDSQICVTVEKAKYDDLSACYPVKADDVKVKAGDCIQARFPSNGTVDGPRPNASLGHVKILDRECEV